MKVLLNPCSSCPYRRDTPPGVWDSSEYAKLLDYADGADHQEGIPHLALFLCHQTRLLGEETVCRGWLTVEQDSLAVRLALMKGAVTPEQVYVSSDVPLYATGQEAAVAGLAGIARPTPDAKRLIRRLLTKGIGRR